MKSALKETTTYEIRQNYEAADITITVSLGSAFVTIQAYIANI
jgi:hypothetical protein